jgi:hypothetical protein
LNKLIAGILLMLIVCIATAPAVAQTLKPALVVSDTSVSPGTLMAGDNGEITITVANSLKAATGDTTSTSTTYSYAPSSPTTSNGITAASQYSTSTTTTSTDNAGANIYLNSVSLSSDGPVRVVSQSFSNVGALGTTDSAKFTFEVRADSNAADGTYFLIFRISTNDSGVYLNYPVKVKVDNTPVKMILSDSPSQFTTSQGSVVFDVVNQRQNDITDVSVIPAGNEYKFSPAQEYYVGTIGTGEMYTVQFNVASKNLTHTTSPSFQVIYYNGNNQHISAPVTVQADTTIDNTSGQTDSGSIMIVVGLLLVFIIIIGGAFVYLRSKRSKL